MQDYTFEEKPKKEKKKISPVAIGCFGCSGAIFVFILFIVIIVAFAFNMIKSSDVYKTALNKAQNSFGVTETLGEPIEPGFFVSGKISTSDNSGYADFKIPISGPRGSGKIFVTANKNDNQWQFSTLYVKINGQDLTINLLE